MELKKIEKQAVLAAIQQNNGNISYNDLEKSTGLGFVELSTVIGILAKENQILIRINHSTENTRAYKSASEFLCARFMDLLFLHCERERSVSFYASQLCVTAKYLSIKVKEVSGKSPTEWIREETIKIIEHMLCHTQHTIKEISNQLNFPNTSFFGKYFKAQKGMSPKLYRQTYIQSLSL